MKTVDLLATALGKAQPGNRNETGLWLACQLRDNGYSKIDAEAVMREYAATVHGNGGESYTVTEALASLRQMVGGQR